MFYSQWKEGMNIKLLTFLINELNFDINEILLLEVEKYYGADLINKLKTYFENFKSKISKICLFIE